MKKLSLTLLASLMSLQVQAADVYVYPSTKSDTNFIRIIQTEDSVGFRYCSTIERSCSQIGNKAYYSKTEIKRKRAIEYSRMTAVGALDAGLAVLGLAGGAYVGAAVVSTAGSASAVGYTSFVSAYATTATTTGAVGGLSISQALAWSEKKLNPKTYFDSAQVVTQALGDRNKIVKNMDAYVKRLEQLLSEI